MTDFILAASILSANFGNLSSQISELEHAGVDWIHVDVMDGHFVPNITMGPFIVRTFKGLTHLPLDVHLMITQPDKFVDTFQKAGADWISVHVEVDKNISKLLKKIDSLGAKPCVVINPETPVSQVQPYIDLVDMILIMSVHPGYSGQIFIPSSLNKISELRKILSLRNSKVRIEVDGGITPLNIRQVINAGADVIVAATSIFQNPNGISTAVKSLRDAVK